MTAVATSRIGQWLSASLSRKLMLGLATSLTLASLCFLAVVLGFYRHRMIEERSFASSEINRLLQVGLENAMLKRDIEGLRQIVDGLGRQEKIVNVMILTPTGETRFASDPALLGKRFDLDKGELCPGCKPAGEASGAYSALLTDPIKGDFLRSINPVRNREPCLPCHGRADVNPINGILVVDYDATQVRQDISLAMLGLSSAGFVVLLAAIAGMKWVMNRSILKPLKTLTSAADDLNLNRLGRRLKPSGKDEMAHLGRAFDAMAGRIERGVQDVEERERFLQAMIDAMPDGVRVIDQNYRVVKANAAYCRQHGRALEEILRVPCYRSSHDRDEPCPPTLITCPLHEFRQGGGALTCRHRHVKSDGSELHVEVSAAPCEINMPGANAPLLVEVIRDLSKDMHLSHEQRLSEIGLLAAGVAHEIHNPLASIHLGFASINRALAEGRYESATRNVSVIYEQIERCIDITSRLLKLSASPSDMPELVALDAIVPEVVSLLSAEAELAAVTTVIDIRGNPRVIGSDSELRMMVLNLAQNAIHAMPSGGKLTICGLVDEDLVRLTFDDTGVGIADADLARIFDPFWSRRGDGVRGTGLGLPICREIIKRMNGTITVTSSVGRGTRFVVTMPSADAEATRS